MEKQKRKTVPTDVVLQATFDGLAAGLTSAQVAEKLGMTPNSYSVRLSHLRKALKPLGKDIPRFNGRKGGNVQELADKYADSLVNVENEKVSDPTVAEVLSE